MNKFNNLTKEQKSVYASDKLEAMHFFAHKKLQETELEMEGIIPSLLSEDQLKSVYASQVKEIEVINYLFKLVEENY